MKCLKCQFENPDSAKFCSECGNRLEVVCSKCGKTNLSSSKFCAECGQDLREPKQTHPIDYSKPHSYTPKFLADKILTTRSSIEGERKLVTVLFADVANFTAMTEKLDPEEVHQIMDGCFRILMNEIHKCEGTINQFTGDGVMALFGAPVAHEDHAQRACYAALSIQKALAEYGKEVKNRYGMDFRMRIGLNSGPVVVGSIGDNLRMDYTAIGDTTNLASRIESAATPGTILVSDHTHRLVRDFFDFQPFGKIAVTGKEGLQEAFELIRAGEVTTRIEAAVAKGLTRFVGRHNSMATFMEAYEKVRSGLGQVVGIVGEAGVGKSRLLLEFRNRLPQNDFTYLEGRCIHFGGTMAYLPILDILRSYFRIVEGESDSIIRKRMTKRVQQLDDKLWAILLPLQDLLSLKVEDEAYLKLEPKQRRERIFEALRDLLIRESQNRPLVLAIEDLHWIDKTSEEFLDYLIGWLANAKVLLILLQRPEYTHLWGSKSYFNRIGLNQLTLKSSADLVEAILEGGEVAPELRDLILSRAAGNPLFMEELTHTLLENGSIQRKENQYVLTQKPFDLQVPETIQGIIAARIDRLEEDLKRIIQIASVIGREFTFDILQAIVDTKADLKFHLLNLQHLEFIYEKRLFPELEYIFKHTLTQEVAYNSLLLKRRKEIHARIGKAIELLYLDRLEDFYEILAHHHLRSENPEKIVDYSIKAGDKASKIFAWQEAIKNYETALEFLKKENKEQRAAVMQKLATPTLVLGDFEASLRYSESALELYEELGDKRNALGMHMHIQVIYLGGYWDGAKEDKALKHLEAIAAIVEEDLDTVEKGLIYQRMGHLYLHRSQPATTLAWAKKAVDLFTKLGIPMGTSLGTALTYTGHIEEGIAYNERNWDSVLKSSNPVVIGILGHELTLTLALARNIPKATDWAERILPETTKAGPAFEGFLRRPLALIYTLSGNVAKAGEVCQTEERVESKTLLGCYFEDTAGIGFHYLRQGNWDRAKGYLEWAISVHQDRNNMAAVSACSLVLGSLHIEMGNHPKAEELLLRSSNICRKGGNVLFELWVLPVLCELYLKMGQPAKATEFVQRGFELLKPDQNWYGLPASLHLAKGILATFQQDWETATESFDEAIQLSKEYQLPWDEAKGLYERGLMYIARDWDGDRERANIALDEALKIFQSIEAKKEVEKVLNKKGEIIK